MKQVGLIMLLCFTSFYAIAQSSVEIPKKEFTVHADAQAVDIAAGSTGKINLQIMRSKNFQKSEASFRVASSLPEGITIRYDAQNESDYAAVITTTAQVTPGTYQVIMNCTIHNKTKGVIVKLKII
ncbi:hypothetical protein ACFQ21_05475 [Ohtaekwangia kribbensis]|jgi:hypothetical protein|uniref:Uncharacterized protein n=1 Tax=Ohtaekwangia kribbensis TaxID=688913 RepID=A0ABW3JY44_9BACT